MPTTKTIHRCKEHGELYTVCPACSCQYCARTWRRCPRTDWHPAHANTEEETGRRWRLLQMAGAEVPEAYKV
jgi:hypothetical protein